MDAARTRLAALRLLNRRDYSVAEIRTRLLDKEHPPDLVASVIDQLVEERLLDDQRVAVAHVRQASLLKGRGRLRIARELEARGLSRSLVQDALSGLAPEAEVDSIRRFLSRKRLPPRLTPADHRKVFQQLLRRGFSADVIATVIRDRGSDDDV